MIIIQFTSKLNDKTIDLAFNSEEEALKTFDKLFNDPTVLSVWVINS